MVGVYPGPNTTIAPAHGRTPDGTGLGACQHLGEYRKEARQNLESHEDCLDHGGTLRNSAFRF